MRFIKSATLALMLSYCLVLSQQGLAQDPEVRTSEELIDELLAANAAWLRPVVEELDYQFEMKRTSKAELKETVVRYRRPGRVTIERKGESHSYRIDNAYDPHNSAHAPKLQSILQGVTFFGPLHELAMAPGDFRMSFSGEEDLAGRRARVFELLPTGRPSKPAIRKWEERVRESATLPESIYRLTPIMIDAGGESRAVLSLESLFDEGPSWGRLQESLEADPTRLEWEQRSRRWPRKLIYRAIRFETREGMRPFIALRTGQKIEILPSVILKEGPKRMHEGIRESLAEFTPRPERSLAMRIGCGIWGTWFGYYGGGVESDRIWVDAESGAVVREEGYSKNELRFRIQYRGYETRDDEKQSPTRITVSLFDGENKPPWVFDMTFDSRQGQVWLLKELTQRRGDEVTAKASVTLLPIKPSS